MSRKLRALYSFPHPLGAAGIGTTAWQQVQAAADLGTEMTVFTTSVARPLRGSVVVVETLRFFGSRIPHRALGVTRAWRYHDRRVARHIQSNVGDYDVIHCWPASCEATLAAARYVFLPSLREVPSAHTELTLRRAQAAAAATGIELHEGCPFRFSPEERARELREFAAADRLLVPSEYCESSFIDQSIPADRLVRHGYGFDPRAFFPDDRPSRTAPVMLYVGRIEPTKGLHHALEAWRRSAAGAMGARFLIVGSAQPSYREYLRRWLDDPSVVELGFRHDVARLMRSSDVVVVPSAVEGSALVTYEAIGSGCALLVSTSAGTPSTRPCLEHEFGDVDTLAQQMNALAQDGALRERLKCEARAVRSTLTWRAAGERLVAIYDETSRWHLKGLPEAGA